MRAPGRIPQGNRVLAKCARALASAAVRILVLAISISLSGVRAFESVQCDEASGGCSNCPAENQGDECPPGCAICHCAHGGVVLPRAVQERLAVVRNDGDMLLLPPYEAAAPQAPFPRGVYRPPRGLSLAS